MFWLPFKILSKLFTRSFIFFTPIALLIYVCICFKILTSIKPESAVSFSSLFICLIFSSLSSSSFVFLFILLRSFSILLSASFTLSVFFWVSVKSSSAAFFICSNFVLNVLKFSPRSSHKFFSFSIFFIVSCPFVFDLILVVIAFASRAFLSIFCPILRKSPIRLARHLFNKILLLYFHHKWISIKITNIITEDHTKSIPKTK